MKANKLTILFALTITIIVLAAIISNLQSWNEGRSTRNPFHFDQVIQEKVSKIEIIRFDESIMLIKTDDAWKVGEQLADNSAINSFVTTINGITVLELSSTKEENHYKFQVDEETGIIVKFYSKGDNLIESFIAGKYAAGGGMFIRQEGENEVFKISENLSIYLDKSKSDWELPENSENSAA